MKKITKALIATAVVGGSLFATAACTSNADQASRNISTAAEQFEVQRRIVGVNGLDGTYAFDVEGRCSIERANGQLEVTCKHGPDDFRKHYVGLSDNTFYVVTQLDPIDVSEYHTRVIIKPESLLPDLDLETSGETDSK